GGDMLSTTFSMGRGEELRTLKEIRNPDSLGEIYTAITSWLGFHPNADEGKVMGLAPYGTERYVPVFRDFVRLHGDGGFSVNLTWFGYQTEGRPLSKRYLALFGAPRTPESELTGHHQDVA